VAQSAGRRVAQPAGRRIAGTGPEPVREVVAPELAREAVAGAVLTPEPTPDLTPELAADLTPELPLTQVDVEPTAPLPLIIPEPPAPATVTESTEQAEELPTSEVSVEALTPGTPAPARTSGRRAAPAADAQTSGRRRAAKPTRSRRPVSPVAVLRTLPSAPVIAGLAALAVSVGGAVSVSDSPVSAATAAPAVEHRLQKVGALTGSGAVATTNLLAERKKVVSRDASREDADVGEEEIVEAAEEMSQERTAALARFAKQAEKQAKVIELNQWVLPLAGYRLSAHFGASSGLWASTHTGLDFAASYGAPIRAVAGGVVTEVGYDGSYGNKTVITLDDGTEIWYAHQSSFGVSVGQEVRSGDVIGYVGSTGNSTGSHLHLEVRPGAGDPVDPYGALVVHGLRP
jgi:murein DD-endopeptidase MepM/ murein hydrolase activator NlpD